MALSELESELARRLRSQSNDETEFPNLAVLKSQGLRQMAEQLLAAADTAVEMTAKRHLARQAFELAQQAEALARSL